MRSVGTSSAWVSRGDGGNAKVKLLSCGTNTWVTLLAPEEEEGALNIGTPYFATLLKNPLALFMF
jgi:hypothetical protein